MVNQATLEKAFTLDDIVNPGDRDLLRDCKMTRYKNNGRGLRQCHRQVVGNKMGQLWQTGQ